MRGQQLISISNPYYGDNKSNLLHDDVFTLAGITASGPGLGRQVREVLAGLFRDIMDKHGLAPSSCRSGPQRSTRPGTSSSTQCSVRGPRASSSITCRSATNAGGLASPTFPAAHLSTPQTNPPRSTSCSRGRGRSMPASRPKPSLRARTGARVHRSTRSSCRSCLGGMPRI